MNIDEKLQKLLENDEIQKIFKRLNNIDFSKLTFSEKKAIFTKYNELIENELNTMLHLYINRTDSQGNNHRTVNLSIDDSKLVIDGLNRNPYFYLRDILLMHLIYLNDDNCYFVQIGDVGYNTNYTELLPNLSVYNSNNITMVKRANKFVKHFISNVNNQYKNEYLISLDNTLTQEGIEDLKETYDIIDKYMSDGILDNLIDIYKKIEKIFSKGKLSSKELAMLSLNEVCVAYFAYAIDKKYKQDRMINHYQQFIDEFFPEYRNYVHLKITKKGMYINNRIIKDDELVMDVLLQQIAQVESKCCKIDSLISDEELKKFNVNGKNYTKLELYFYDRLDNLDSLLGNNNFELINYLPWKSIYRDSHSNKMIDSGVGPFKNLIEDKTFLSLIDKILNCKENEQEKLFYKLINMMNQTYHVNFKLNINNNISIDTSLGTADNESSIYLNLNNNFSRVSILATLFHEYRHLMQYNEMKHNSGVYSPKALKIISLNGHMTPFKKDYNYAASNTVGYVNDLFYYMQPLELDAEDFSKAMIENIFQRLENAPNIGRLCFADTFNDNVYFDREKISLEAYKNFLKIDNVEKVVKEEEKDYKILKEAIERASDYDDAIKIFKFRTFTSLAMSEKVKIYKLIVGKEEHIEYDEQTSKLSIGTKKYSTKNITDFELLEEILLLRAKKKVNKGQLKISDMNEYIYKESRKFKTSKYDIFSCFQAYDYHVCFDKYHKEVQNKYHKRK